MMSAPAPLTREFGTRLLQTEVHGRGPSTKWHRRPGPEAPAPFTSDGAIDRELAASLGDQVRLLVGTPAHSGRSYDLPGNQSVASLMLEASFTDRLPPVLYHLGKLLAEVHTTSWEHALPDDPPRGARRLRDWLRGTPCTLRAQTAACLVREHLGDEWWLTLQDWAAEPSNDPVLLHGAPGLGSLVLAEDDDHAVLLIGEDVSSGPATYDVGWVLGELAELAWQLRWPESIKRSALDSFLAGYGTIDLESATRWMILRVLLHMHDYSAYTDGPVTVLSQYSHFVRHLLTHHRSSHGRA